MYLGDFIFIDIIFGQLMLLIPLSMWMILSHCDTYVFQGALAAQLKL